MKNYFLLLVLVVASQVALAQNYSIFFKEHGIRNIYKDAAITAPIRLDPNIVHDFLKVSVDPVLADSKKTIAIYDILGRELILQNFSGGDIQIMNLNLAHGLYFVKIDSPDYTIVSKFEVVNGSNY